MGTCQPSAMSLYLFQAADRGIKTSGVSCRPQSTVGLSSELMKIAQTAAKEIRVVMDPDFSDFLMITHLR